MGAVILIRRMKELLGFRLIALGIVFALGVSQSPFVAPINNSISALYFGLPLQKSVQNAGIVAIDTESLRAENYWPWPRRRYADLIDRLESMGARQIVFDIDFSSPSDDDAIFSAAIENAAIPIYLASHRQPLFSESDIVAEMVPVPSLRRHAQLVTTAYIIDPDGIIRRYEDSEEFSFGIMPHVSGAAAQKAPMGTQHPVDFGFDLSTMPVVPFEYVLRGDAGPSPLAGRTVFVGATAPELGDEFATPRLGVLPGVALNALAFESAAQDTTLDRASWWGDAILVLIALLVASCRPAIGGGRAYWFANFAAAMVILGAPYLIYAQGSVVMQPAIALCTQTLLLMIRVGLMMDHLARQGFKSKMHVQKHAAMLATIMDGNREGVLVVNHSGAIESGNEKAAQLLGLKDATFIGCALEHVRPEFVSIDWDNGDQHVLELAQAGGTAVFVAASRNTLDMAPADSRFEVRKTARTLHIYTLYDLTSQKELEQAERAAKEAFAEASRAKSTLIDVMSHELRTPLNSVIGFSDLIADESFGAHAQAEYKEFGEMIRASGNQLLGVVNDLLLAGQFQGKTVSCSPGDVDIANVVEAALDRIKSKPTWNSPTICLENLQGRLPVDRSLMMTALFHLLDNASKFGGAKCTVQVSALETEQGLHVVVEDDGPGVDATQVDKLTGLFVQADGARNRQFEGCGLGLYLVEQVTLHHGGQMKVSSQPNAGFRVDLLFPTSEQKALPADAAA